MTVPRDEELISEMQRRKERIHSRIEDLEGQANLRGYKLKVATKDTATHLQWTVTLTSTKDGHTFVGASSQYSERDMRYLDALQKAVEDMMSFENRLG